MSTKPEILAYKYNSARRLVWSDSDPRFTLICFCPTIDNLNQERSFLKAIEDTSLVKAIQAQAADDYRFNYGNTNIVTIFFETKQNRTEFIKKYNVNLIPKYQWQMVVKLSQ